MALYQYTLLSQEKNIEEKENDVKLFFEDLHNHIRASFENRILEDKKAQFEFIQKHISNLRGVLSPYLTTPLTSDKNDIDFAIKENLQHLLEKLSPSSSIEPLTVVTYKILETSQVPLHRQIVGVIKRLLKNGRNQVTESGIVTGKSIGSAFCTQIQFGDFSLAGELHAMLAVFQNDRKPDNFLFANDVASEIVDIKKNSKKSKEQSMLLQWDGKNDLLASIQKNISTSADQFGISNISISKKSMYAGFGSRYQLQCSVELQKHALGSIVLSLIGDDEELEDAITTQGSLMILEKIT